MKTILLLVVAAGGAEPEPVAKADVVFKHKVLGDHGAAGGPAKSPDGKFAVKADGMALRLLGATTGKEVRALTQPDRPRKGLMGITHWAFSPNGKLIAVGLGDVKGRSREDTAGLVCVWDVATGSLLCTSKRYIGRVTGLKFLDNKTVMVWNLDISGK